MADAKQFFAEKLKIPESDIVDIEFPCRGEGDISAVNCRWRVVWRHYAFVVHYIHRTTNSWVETEKQTKTREIPTVETKTRSVTKHRPDFRLKVDDN